MASIKLGGKVAVITGGSRGLGLAIARALGRAGGQLALVARDAERLACAAHELRAEGIVAETWVTDVTDQEQVAALGEAVLHRFGTVHILVNSAGINLRLPLIELTPAQWRQVIDTNLTGVFLVARAFIPRMRAQRFGRIINLTSIMSHVALPGRTAYCASKAGLLGLTRALALELAPDGITVNGISPGPFATDMNRPLLDSPELSRWWIDRVPVGSWGQPSDVGELAVYLCSDQASYITGTDIVIDGGYTAQ